MTGANGNVIMSGWGNDNPDDERGEAARGNTKSVSRGADGGGGRGGDRSQRVTGSRLGRSGQFTDNAKMAQKIQAFGCDHLILNQGSAGNTGTAADLRGRGSRGLQITAQIGEEEADWRDDSAQCAIKGINFLERICAICGNDLVGRHPKIMLDNLFPLLLFAFAHK